MQMLSRFKNGTSHNRKNGTSHRKNATSRIVDFCLSAERGEPDCPASPETVDKVSALSHGFRCTGLKGAYGAQTARAKHSFSPFGETVLAGYLARVWRHHLSRLRNSRPHRAAGRRPPSTRTTSWWRERAGHVVANLHSVEPTMGCSRRSV